MGRPGRDEAEMEMMKMQQRAGFKLHACRQKRDEEISAAVRARMISCFFMLLLSSMLTYLSRRRIRVCVSVRLQLAAHWAQTSQLLASGAAVCRNFYGDRERAFAAQGSGPRE